MPSIHIGVPSLPNDGKPAAEMKARKDMERVPKGNRQLLTCGFYSVPTFGLLRKNNLAESHLVEVIY